MKTLIAVPCMDDCKSLFAQSLAMLNVAGDVEVAFSVSSLVYTARNELAKRAVEHGTDYVLWLDSDIMFPPNLFQRLFDDIDKKDFVTGIYFRRAMPFTPVINKELTINDDGCSWSDYESYPDEIFEIAGCGFGCALVRTSVIFDVLNEYHTAFSPINGVGEDLSFCWRARQLGYKLYCDPKIQVGHIGTQIVTEEFYKAFRSAKKVSSK